MVCLSPPTISETHSQTRTGLYYSPPLLFSDLTQLSTLLSTYSAFCPSIASQKDLENILQTLELCLPRILRSGFLLPLLATSAVAHLLDATINFSLITKGQNKLMIYLKGKDKRILQWKLFDNKRKKSLQKMKTMLS